MRSTTIQSLTLLEVIVCDIDLNVKVFDMPRHLTDQIHVNYIP